MKSAENGARRFCIRFAGPTYGMAEQYITEVIRDPYGCGFVEQLGSAKVTGDFLGVIVCGTIVG
jgi:hypothetical protein